MLGQLQHFIPGKYKQTILTKIIAGFVGFWGHTYNSIFGILLTEMASADRDVSTIEIQVKWVFDVS